MQPKLTETIACPVCGSGQFTVLRGAAYDSAPTLEEFTKVYCSSSDTKLMDQLVRCSGCELVYLNPRISEALALQSYTNAEDTTFVTQNAMRILTFRRTLKKIAARLGITGPQRLLDVGCAGGAFVKAATDEGYEATGVEPSAWLCGYGRKTYGLDLRQGVLNDQGFAPKQFDMVTLWDVLEHMHHPSANLDTCRNILKDDGHLIVNYPEYASFPRRVMGFNWPFFLSVHLYYFTPQTVERLLAKNGFKVVYTGMFWQTLELSYVLGRAASYFGIFSLAQKAVDALGLGKLPLTYYVGQTLVIAKKA